MCRIVLCVAKYLTSQSDFLNAVIEADSKRLSKVAVLRLSGPYTARCPPFTDFPSRLRIIIEGHTALIDGGLESKIALSHYFIARLSC